MTEFTTYRLHTQVDLVDLGKQFQQKQGETWLLGFRYSGTQGWARNPWEGALWVLTERSRGVACEMPF